MALLTLSAATTADRETLGGKAWSITEMLRLGLPVPPAFTLSTEECGRYHAAGRVLGGDILAALPGAMAELEAATGRSFGGGERPLLVSVRSGAPTSMPGMMDTILNLGMTDAVQDTLAAAAGREYAADIHRRFVEQFESVVGGEELPARPIDQLHRAIAAVFDSWNSPRATHFRAHRGIPDTGGTAVTVQVMVFGNLDDRSGTGVMFSRDPTGASDQPYGEWLPGGQGEDVVSGAVTPRSLDELAAAMPEVHAQLLEAAATLDRAAGEAQDIEFTVESGRLWLLQCRRATVAGTDGAAPTETGARVLAEGRPANPGRATGVVVTDVEAAEERALDGEFVILARPTTNPHDVRAMSVVAAIVTEVGGATSHAAVVSRELGVPCVVGVGEGVLAGLEGLIVTVDATTGRVLEEEG